MAFMLTSNVFPERFASRVTTRSTLARTHVYFDGTLRHLQ